MLLAVIALMLMLHGYIGYHLFRSEIMPAWGARFGSILLVALFASIPLSMILRRRGRSGAVRWMLPLAYFWMGSFGVLLSVVFVSDLARWAFLAVHAPLAAVDLSELARAQALAIVVVGAALVAWAVRTARGRAQVERVQVAIPGLGTDMVGLTIAQISDIHIGETLRRPFLEQTVAQVNALDADIVAITGDLVDGYVRELKDEVAPLGELKARLGVFFVTGNHEYYWDGPAWEGHVRALGVTVLHNEHKVLRRGQDAIALGGVTDLHGGDFAADHDSRPDLAFAGAPTGIPRVLLAHQPKSAEAASRAGVALQLSGHTHGGQIYPFNLFVRLQQPAVAGLKRLYGIWVYTHRGTGFWGPAMRLGPTPEIALLELVRG